MFRKNFPIAKKKAEKDPFFIAVTNEEKEGFAA